MPGHLHEAIHLRPSEHSRGMSIVSGLYVSVVGQQLAESKVADLKFLFECAWARCRLGPQEILFYTKILGSSNIVASPLVLDGVPFDNIPRGRPMPRVMVLNPCDFGPGFPADAARCVPRGFKFNIVWIESLDESVSVLTQRAGTIEHAHRHQIVSDIAHSQELAEHLTHLHKHRMSGARRW